MIYSPEDFRTSTPPRIMGSETEYNVRHMTDEMDFQPYVHTVGFYREKSRDDGKDLWLANGARLYVDAGGIVEYATAEVSDAHSLLRQERAGETIVQNMADEMLADADAPGVKKNPVYKRSGYALPGQDRMTAGHHENYTTIIPSYEGAVDKESHPFHHALRSYLSTRAVWAGAGLVSEGRYGLSQKMTSIDFSARTKTSREGSKPAYLMTEGLLNQLEIRVGDGNMSDWAIVQKYAFTSLLLRMIEQGEYPQHLLIPKGTANEALMNTDKFMPVRVGNGEISAATHQREIAEYAIMFASQYPDMPQEEIDAAYEIIEVCHQIEAVDATLFGIGPFADRVDWASKLMLMRTRGIDDPTNKNPLAVSLDLHWESIAKSSISRHWYADADAPKLASEDSIDTATILAPTTRALARVAVLDSLDGYPNTISWHKVEQAGRSHSLRDPYDASASIA